MIVDNIRAVLFKGLDFLKGNSIGSHYKKLKYLMEKADYNQLLEFQSASLTRLLQHAQETTMYYYAANFEKITDFPVVNKKIITDNKEAFLSSSFKGDLLHSVSTSGSTGTPFTIYQDKRKTDCHKVDTIYFNELSGLNLGNRLFYFRVWDKLVKKSTATFFVQNILPLDASKLDCEHFESTFFQELKNETTKVCLLAYASTFEALSKCIANKQRGISKVKSIITMSETLPEGSRALLENYFSCPVVSRYSNMENGMIGIQIKEVNNYYLLNEVSFIIEVLQFDTDKTVEDGEMGRIVITDLFNFSQPLIRYDTGDIGSVVFELFKGKKRKFLKKIEGRKVDFISSTTGLLVSPHTITNTMWRYQFIKQFQFIQLEQNTYKLILNMDLVHQNKLTELISDLKNYLGEDAILSTEFTDEIPLLNSGKRKKIVNLYQV